MKKLLAILLALTFVLSMFVMTACTNGEGEETDNDAVSGNDETNGETEGNGEETDGEPEGEETDGETEGEGDDVVDEPNMFPYEGEYVPGSVNFDWGAPDATSICFEIDADHVIHDGKGTWSNQTSTLPPMAFDGDYDTCYDCDEQCGTENDANMEVGLVLEDWDGDTTKTGYVGAWIEEGVVLTQIRFFPRTANLGRETGCKFQASVDGVNWVDLVVIEELVNGGYDYEFYDIEDDTVYYYVRFLGRDLEAYNEYVDAAGTDYYSYCNIAEMEIWGTPAN